MKIKFLLLTIAQISLASVLNAQTKARTLVKGEIIPEGMILGKMVNHKLSKAKFSDFKGKLVILDFWSTHCGPCVAGLPRMDSLQKKYEKRIAIIPITAEGSLKIRDYFNKRKFILPSVVEDKTLYKIFPQTALDLHVWINEKGKIIATTSGNDVNFSTVEEYLKTGEINAKERVDIVKGFDSSKPLFVNGNGGSGNDFLGRSIMTIKAIVGEQTVGIQVNYYQKKNGENMFKSILLWNGSPKSLYHSIISGIGKLSYLLFFKENEIGQIVPISTALDLQGFISDMERYTNKSNFTINYELTIPEPGVVEKIFLRDYLLNDLNRYFDFTARIVKVKLHSWVITRKKEYNIISKEEEKRSGMIFNDDIDEFYLEDVKYISIEEFIKLAKACYPLSPPIFNETGLKNEKINLSKLHLKFNQDKANYRSLDLEEWRAAFQRNGLDIKVEDREVEVMVFKKKETPSK